MERENKRLHDQLEDQRVQHKQLMTALSRECKRSGTRAHEESQRANELSHRLDRERAANQTLRAELEEEKKRAMQMEARREELLAEFDTEREQLGLRIRKEEARCNALQEELERLRREMRDAEERSDKTKTKMNGHLTPTEEDASVEKQLTNGSSPTSSQAHSPTTSNQSPDVPSVQAAYQAGINQRFHAARHKFQGTSDQESVSSPPNSPQDLLSCVAPPDNVSSKQAARITVTQALSRFSTQQGASTPTSPNSSPFGTDYRTLAHSGMLSPTIRSPTIPRADRGNPPPLPPKKPGLAETPLSPATLRAAHLAKMSAGCGRGCNPESSKEPDLVLSSSG
ncbi:CTTNBP2 N-terminal-like protein [Pimephales promelas]|nr:CTTNBP2 N-terminal-like protein [Pimephales promelas]